ncbi:MAG: hypothetical protein MJA83_17025 [Gammaproteobacteria bacterium]|nr:hypothetical protein [Gammaproteobacteria bacterium]
MVTTVLLFSSFLAGFLGTGIYFWGVTQETFAIRAVGVILVTAGVGLADLLHRRYHVSAAGFAGKLNVMLLFGMALVSLYIGISR